MNRRSDWICFAASFRVSTRLSLHALPSSALADSYEISNSRVIYFLVMIHGTWSNKAHMNEYTALCRRPSSIAILAFRCFNAFGKIIGTSGTNSSRTTWTNVAEHSSIATSKLKSTAAGVWVFEIAVATSRTAGTSFWPNLSDIKLTHASTACFSGMLDDETHIPVSRGRNSRAAF